MEIFKGSQKVVAFPYSYFSYFFGIISHRDKQFGFGAFHLHLVLIYENNDAKKHSAFIVFGVFVFFLFRDSRKSFLSCHKCGGFEPKTLCER